MYLVPFLGSSVSKNVICHSVRAAPRVRHGSSLLSFCISIMKTSKNTDFFFLVCYSTSLPRKILFYILVHAYLSLPFSQTAVQQCWFLMLKDLACFIPVIRISAKAEVTSIPGLQSALGSFRMKGVI